MSVAPNGDLYACGATLENEAYVVAKSTLAKDPAVIPFFDFAREVDLGGTIAQRAEPNPGGLLGQAWIETDHSGGPNHGNVYMLSSVWVGDDDLLDVMFILIIFFLATTTFKEEERDIQVRLPEDVEGETLSSSDRVIVINIRKSGAYVMLDQQVTVEEMRELVADSVREEPGQKTKQELADEGYSNSGFRPTWAKRGYHRGNGWICAELSHPQGTGIGGDLVQYGRVRGAPETEGHASPQGQALR